MTTKQLKDLRETAAKQKRKTDAAIKAVEKIKVPKQARDEKKTLRRRLRRFFKSRKVRIRKLTKRIKRRKARSGGAVAAVKWGVSQIGVTEKPSGSNWGVPVQDWIKFTGYSSPVPWCGCFAAYALIAKGGAKIPTRIRLGYAGYIVDDARNGRNGLRAVSFDQALPGDILVFWGDKHIGVVREKPSGSTIRTVEGNTSSGVSGSQNNGGGVYGRTRSRSDVTVVARPSY